MLQKTLIKFKTGNKKDRHWVIFSMLIFSWLLAMLGLVMVRYGLQGIGGLLVFIGLPSGFIFMFMGFWNMLFGPNNENK